MKHTNTRRYAVKRSQESYASIISSHCTLPEAYKSLVKYHKKRYAGWRFIMAQDVIAVISSEASAEVIQKDIDDWSTFDVGPQSKQRLPLPIVVHQWNPEFKLYLRYGEKRS